MLSVVIATLNCERALARTLKELVPGAVEGLITEVIVADGGSHDGTAAVADAAGCDFLSSTEVPARRLKTAAEAARAPWFLFLRPGIVLDPPWVAEVRRFIEQPPTSLRAAVFRRAGHSEAVSGRIAILFAAALRGLPSPEQGLLIPRHFYERIGGHRGGGADPEAEVLRRIGRQRLVTLSAGAVRVDT